jgi:quercetin dioxygenase-like cupin family protein
MEGRTYLRTHTLKAEHLLLDLGDAAVDLRSLAEDGQDRRAVTLVRESGINVVLVYLRPEATMREHAAPGPATVQVLDGHVRLDVGDEQMDMPAGRLVAFDAGVRHEVHAIEHSTLLLTLSDPQSAGAQ